MSDDKGFPLPNPVTGYPLICVTLKIPDVLQYRQDFLGHIWQLGKWWVWEQSGEPGDTRAAQAGEYWRQLLYDHLKIGDCPVDCCDDILAAIAALQTQANDQAALQLTTDVTNRQIASQALRDALEDRYDGNPTSINPNAPVTDFGAAGDRYDALCAGLTAFVYQFARGQADSVRAGQVGGLLAVAAIAALLIPGLNFFFVVGASIAVLLGLGTIGVTTETAITALTDQTALNAVICYMRETLKDQDVTEANWSACLDSYPFTPGSNAAIVADFLKATLADNYLTILNILGQAYTGVIDGDVMPECPCDPPPTNWCRTINLKASNGSTEGVQIGAPEFPYSLWVFGEGVRSTDPLDRVWFDQIMPSVRDLDEVTIEWEFVPGEEFSPSNVWLGHNGDEGLPTSIAEDQTSFSVYDLTAVEDLTFILERSGFNETRLANITRITLRGQGTNPFGGDNC